MKTHWISEISYARRTRRRHSRSGRWYTFIKRQASRQARRNAQYDINEGLDEVFFGPEDERTHVEWERAEQTQLMDQHQHILRAALDFACRRIDYFDEPPYYNDDAVWRDADNNTVAYSEWTGIEVLPEHHDFVWNVFKMFL